ncbi:hypothetical protein [Microbacterium esteraromaticum]|uniref:hypothetical protein n=1 Tax=Microbacterium esteraromaticum TaxID=57043 RepID=UPI001D2AB337|nr:hypothetical protein [Microbacterium esteraromaticum]
MTTQMMKMASEVAISVIAVALKRMELRHDADIASDHALGPPRSAVTARVGGFAAMIGA